MYENDEKYSIRLVISGLWGVQLCIRALHMYGYVLAFVCIQCIWTIRAVFQLRAPYIAA